jgi:NCAIR mutase (PurE)-related protein
MPGFATGLEKRSMSESGKAVVVIPIGIIMGSQSDWETMRHAAQTLEALGISHETRIVSAHRTPRRLYDYATSAKSRGLKVIIAGAGGAAHLPGMAAALTPLPVLGVPIESHAGRRTGRNLRDRPRRRGQRRALRRRDPGDRRPCRR